VTRLPEPSCDATDRIVPRSRRWVLCGVVAAGLLTLAACGSDTPAVAIPNVFSLEHDPTAAIDEPDPARGEVMRADVLRSQLERELTWHGITLTQVMRHAHAGDPAVQAWIEELTDNTDDLTAAVGLVYGTEEARAFYQQWAQHTQFLVDYAVSVSAGDRAAADRARSRLAIYTADSGSFFAEVTDGALPSAAVQTLLDTHVGHMVAMIDAVERGDDGAALASALDDNASLAEIAAGLATAMASTQVTAFPGTIDTPEAAYCTIITTGTGNFLLRELFSRGTTTDASAASFQEETGVPLGDVIGVIDQLNSADTILVAQTADLALDRAFDHARPPAP